MKTKKTSVTRSVELIVEHSCGELFAFIPSEEISLISNDNPIIIDCPRCKKKIKITEVEKEENIDKFLTWMKKNQYTYDYINKILIEEYLSDTR